MTDVNRPAASSEDVLCKTSRADPRTQTEVYRLWYAGAAIDRQRLNGVLVWTPRATPAYGVAATCVSVIFQPELVLDLAELLCFLQCGLSGALTGSNMFGMVAD